MNLKNVDSLARVARDHRDLCRSLSIIMPGHGSRVDITNSDMMLHSISDQPKMELHTNVPELSMLLEQMPLHDTTEALVEALCPTWAPDSTSADVLTMDDERLHAMLADAADVQVTRAYFQNTDDTGLTRFMEAGVYGPHPYMVTLRLGTKVGELDRSETFLSISGSDEFARALDAGAGWVNTENSLDFVLGVL